MLAVCLLKQKDLEWYQYLFNDAEFPNIMQA